MLPKMRRVPQEAFLSTECVFRTVGACFWYGALPKTHRTWLPGAQKSGWQLPLRGLSTPGRGRGKLLPLRNLELHKRKRPTLVDLFLIWLLSINAAVGW